MADPATKHCPRCDRDLPRDAFVRNASQKDGLGTYCRECHSEYVRQWREVPAHREEDRARARRWRQDNPPTPEQLERERENHRQWNAANRERKRETNRQWYLKNPGKRRESSARLRQRHPLYKTWEGMLDRCENPACKDYGRYGGRGITICPQWLDFKTFEADVIRLIGPRPKGKSLDRADNNGNYEPGNIKWSTPTEQAANRRPREQWKKRARR